MITKRGVQAVSLERLQSRRDSIVWDMRAGSGSAGSEAARPCPDGNVYAIEKNIDDSANAEQNRHEMQIHNYRVQHAKAPMYYRLGPIQALSSRAAPTATWPG